MIYDYEIWGNRRNYRRDSISLKAEYKFDGGRYIVSKSTRYSNFEFPKEVRGCFRKYESWAEIVILGANVKPDGQSLGEKDFGERTFYRLPPKYTDNFWEKSNIEAFTAEQLAIIAALEKESVSSP